MPERRARAAYRRTRGGLRRRPDVCAGFREHRRGDLAVNSGTAQRWHETGTEDNGEAASTGALHHHCAINPEIKARHWNPAAALGTAAAACAKSPERCDGARLKASGLTPSLAATGRRRTRTLGYRASDGVGPQ